MPHIELIRAAPSQESVLANLLELYVHDFSEFKDLELGPDGRFSYPKLSLYWREANRHPFLLTCDGNLAGFALVQSENLIWDMAEFFVVRKYRRIGIGTHAAHQVWRRFPGPWQVRVMESNRPALQFWQRVIGAFLGRLASSSAIEKDGKRWRVYLFESANL